MENGSVKQLPPGFSFSPTDEELVLHFLYSKASLPSHPNIIPELDLSLLHPWDLNGKALSSGNQHYFFTTVKENRSTENGYWMEIGVTEPIISANNKVGMKKYLVFKSRQDNETSWVMEEYHTCSSDRSSRGMPYHDESWMKWVLCKVYEKKRPTPQQSQYCYSDEDDDGGTEVSWLDEVFMSLDGEDDDDDDDDDLDEPILFSA